MGQSTTKQTNKPITSTKNETQAQVKPPQTLTFHKNHGNDIELLEDHSVAVRAENKAKSWSNGLVLSSTPIKPNQRLYIQFIVVSRASHDVVSVGFTSQNPSDFRYRETEDQTSSWTFSLSKHFCKEDTVLRFYVDDFGCLHYGKINSDGFKSFGRTVETNRPLWAVLHIWSEPTTVKMLSWEEVLQSVPEIKGEDMELFWDAQEYVCEGTKDASVASVASVVESGDKGLCTICCVDELEVVFIPCGHMCACQRCAGMIQNKDNLCPMCRNLIRDVVRVYRS